VVMLLTDNTVLRTDDSFFTTHTYPRSFAAALALHATTHVLPKSV